MSLKLNILPDKAKFLAFYYVKVGWACKSNVITQVTNLTLQEIKSIKENWQLLYMIYIDKHNNENVDVDVLISEIEFFKDAINEPERFYSEIHAELFDQLKWNNIQININFAKLENLYPKDNEFEDISNELYIPQRCEYFVENQLKILDKFNF